MQKIKLRRCLYIGLGGTGMNAILHTKKLFMETYGDVPPMIGFLGIDTDGDIYNKTLDSRFGPIGLDRSEQTPICVDNPIDFYNHNKALVSWLPDKNVKAITTLEKGAGQIRTNGRLAVTFHAAEIAIAIKSAIDEIRSHKILNDKKYELMNSSKDDIHMTFSLCGGTGGGTFRLKNILRCYDFSSNFSVTASTKNNLLFCKE